MKKDIIPNTQRLGKLTFDSNQVRKSSTNPNVLIAKASDGKDYGIVRKKDGSYDFAGSTRNASLNERLAMGYNPTNNFGTMLSSFSTVMSEPQRMMTRALSNNKYNTPSEVIQDSKLPKGLKNTIGFAADVVTDPTNLVGVGLLGKGANTIKSGSKVISNLLPKFSMPKTLKGLSVSDLRNLTQQPGITIQEANKIIDFKNQKVENILTNRFRENERMLKLEQKNRFTEHERNIIEQENRIKEQYLKNREKIYDVDIYDKPKDKSNTSSTVLDDIPTVTNTYSRSGITREGILNRVDDKTKELIKDLPDEEFKNIVLKPNNEVDFIAPTIGKRLSTPNEITPITVDDYVKTFNDNISEFNKIISKKNTSGVPYKAVSLDNIGRLNFESPVGNTYISTKIVPGIFKGKVKDISDPNYYQELPGLNMQNTMNGVFGDRIPRRGSRAYESINEYLKLLNLGRVKPGFNSQTEYSRGAWENIIKSGKGFGYYNSPNTVYGSMKTVLPPAAIAAGAASQLNNKQNGGKLPSTNKLKYGSI